jgi:hypothetical protein
VISGDLGVRGVHTDNSDTVVTVYDGALLEGLVLCDGFTGRSGTSAGGTLRTRGGTLRNCIVSSQDYLQGGRPGVVVEGATTFERCVFPGENICLASELLAPARFLNCVLEGMLEARLLPATLSHCVLSAGIHLSGSALVLENCVVDEVQYSSGSANARRCCFFRTPTPGITQDSCFVADPGFVGGASPFSLSTYPDSIWFTDDSPLLLQSDSPCRNAGTLLGYPAADIRGMPRATTPAQHQANPVDIGPYEQP